MPEHVWSVLCKEPIENKRTNNISMIEVLERVYLTAEPEVDPNKEGPIAIAFQASTVSLFMRSDPEEDESFKLRHRYMAPNGKALATSLTPITMTQLRHRQFGNFGSLPYVGPGIYRIQVAIRADESKRWRVVASVPLEITVADDTNGGAS